MTAFGYGAATRLESIERHFFDTKRQVRECDLLLLRVNPMEIGSDQSVIGAELHWEPEVQDRPEHDTSDRTGAQLIDEWFETTRFTHAPLSDLYYGVVQDAYYSLGARGFDVGDIGAHMNDYMSWGTYRK